MRLCLALFGMQPNDVHYHQTIHNIHFFFVYQAQYKHNINTDNEVIKPIKYNT
jgi:hypothetical protein